MERLVQTRMTLPETPNSLIITVGLPRSGKSTWCQKTRVQLRCPVVSPDAVRLAVTGKRFVALAEPTVWETVRYMVRALFEAGHPCVIVDATNTTKARRKFWLDEARLGKYNGDTAVHFVVFDTDAEECKRRAIADGMDDLVDVIDSMHTGYEPLDSIEEPNMNVNDASAGLMGLL